MWEDHLSHLRAVLTSLQEAGLTSNSAECKLAMTEVIYLEYQDGGSLVKPLMDKVNALNPCLIPCTRRQIHCFLSLMGYYRWFIPNFAWIMAPLSDLLNVKDTKKLQ